MVPGGAQGVPKLTWQEAENACTDYGGHLASISSQSENTYIQSKVLPSRSTNYDYWIGLSEDGATWKWSDETPFLGNTFFDSTIDHGSAEVQDCVGMSSLTGNWIKQNCEMAWGWVCEIRKGVYMEGQEAPLLPSPTQTNGT